MTILETFEAVFESEDPFRYVYYLKNYDIEELKQYDREEPTITPERVWITSVTGKTITELLDNVNAKQNEGYVVRGDFSKTAFGFCQLMSDGHR